MDALPEFSPLFPQWPAQPWSRILPDVDPLLHDLLSVRRPDVRNVGVPIVRPSVEVAVSRSPRNAVYPCVCARAPLAQKMVVLDPAKRISARHALDHPYFSD